MVATAVVFDAAVVVAPDDDVVVDALLLLPHAAATNKNPMDAIVTFRFPILVTLYVLLVVALVSSRSRARRGVGAPDGMFGCGRAQGSSRSGTAR